VNPLSHATFRFSVALVSLAAFQQGSQLDCSTIGSASISHSARHDNVTFMGMALEYADSDDALLAR
jgi:hypothetical protein